MPNVSQALRAGKWVADERPYQLIKLPMKAVTAAASIIAEWGEPFSALLFDKTEVTLILPDAALDAFAARIPGYTQGANPFRLITFDYDFDLEMVGFIAAVSTALATAKVPLFAYASYSGDHFLVPAHRFEDAWAALQKLQSIA